MATEKRLIVLQDAIDIIANTPSEIAYFVTDGRKKHWTANDVLGVLADRQFEIFVLLDNVKRVDAVEVVHGRWKDIWGGKYDNQKFICSVCNGKALYVSQKDELGTWVAVQQLTPFCPHCGAKMDGDGNG